MTHIIHLQQDIQLDSNPYEVYIHVYCHFAWTIF